MGSHEKRRHSRTVCVVPARRCAGVRVPPESASGGGNGGRERQQQRRKHKRTDGALLCPRVSESCPQWRWLHLGPRQPRRRKRCGWTRRSGPAKLRTLATLRPHAADRVPRRLGLPPAAAAPHHGFGALLRPPLSSAPLALTPCCKVLASAVSPCNSAPFGPSASVPSLPPAAGPFAAPSGPSVCTTPAAPLGVDASHCVSAPGKSLPETVADAPKAPLFALSHRLRTPLPSSVLHTNVEASNSCAAGCRAATVGRRGGAVQSPGPGAEGVTRVANGPTPPERRFQTECALLPGTLAGDTPTSPVGSVRTRDIHRHIHLLLGRRDARGEAAAGAEQREERWGAQRTAPRRQRRRHRHPSHRTATRAEEKAGLGRGALPRPWRPPPPRFRGPGRKRQRQRRPRKEPRAHAVACVPADAQRKEKGEQEGMREHTRRHSRDAERNRQGTTQARDRSAAHAAASHGKYNEEKMENIKKNVLDYA
ncbi:uncharacterized protein Tco025E_07980 [Trypanosoma conorhini]|uniref:Uncharacterized protein n=1 Tax=Trypanosoma conorhini TaxID=83891 RepID=A0A422NGA9_9TRYP|nr:uncharacterized protein Tco025E_07980 [Trypanosoma conorhini]RNF04502.1 hypothetical protein Tco025E_07980 [Trypanosoma conorhini]